VGEPATGKCDNDDMKFPDPWEGVPADRRLDFTVIREPIESLAEATILGVERALPVALQAVPGSLAVLLMLAKLVETTFSTIRYICAEKPEDPARRISFATSTPPLLRSMLDAIYTLIFIGEDPPTRFKWYYNAGWRELREEYDRHVQRYSGKTEWKAWLAGYGTHLATLEGQWVTAHEAANPKAIRRWPTPSNMVSSGMLTADAQTFLDYMRDWFYREFSQDDHLSLPGLIRRGSNFLRPADDSRKESTWKKLRSDWVTYAVVLFLAFLTEMVLLCNLDLRPRCSYIWGILKEYSSMAAEVYEARYETKLMA